MERANEVMPLQSAEQFDERFFVCVTNPSVIELTKYAELLNANMTKGKPIQFFGTVPYFVTPNGVVLAEQFGVEPKQWVMQKAEVSNDLSAIDALLGKV